MVLPPRVPELAALDVLVTAARAGSMSAAARELNISQQAVSGRIRALERELGVEVFLRSSSGVEVTPAGVLVLGWADALLDCAEQFSTGVRALLGRTRGRLVVAASMTVAEYLIPEWLMTMRHTRPEIAVKVEPMNSAQVLTALGSGAVDLGFIESGCPSEDLAALPVACDELVLVVRPGHRWARTTGPVSAQAVAATALIQREQGSGTREVFERALAAAGCRPVEPLVELRSVAALKTAVLTSDSAAVLSSFSVADDIHRGNLVAVAVEGVSMPRTLHAVWRKGAVLPESARQLLDCATRSARTAPGS